MNRDRVDESCGVTFQLPGVIKCSLVLVCQLESRAKKALNNKVSEQVMKVLFMYNANRIIFSELVKTLKKKISHGEVQLPKGYDHHTEANSKLRAYRNFSGVTSDGISLVTNKIP